MLSAYSSEVHCKVYPVPKSAVGRCAKCRAASQSYSLSREEGSCELYFPRPKALDPVCMYVCMYACTLYNAHAYVAVGRAAESIEF